MIISASRRTDIPAYYSEWLMKRLKAGFCQVRNPYNLKQCSEISLHPNEVDCIVFWTKNAAPILDKLELIKVMGYAFYFQFTITPYDQNIEKNLPPKDELLETFRRLSDKIGSDRVVWRYDPIIVDHVHTVEYHAESYERMARQLEGYTERSMFSFIDLYRHNRGFCEVSQSDMYHLGETFGRIAHSHHMSVSTCLEAIDLNAYRIKSGACIDAALVESVAGYPIKVRKESAQRTGCLCVKSIDIGSYDSCNHQCSYCYATTSLKKLENNRLKHDPESAMLVGRLGEEECCTKRKIESLRQRQETLF